MTKKKTSKFRSKLEERIADLLSELGISYEYESTRVPYTIQHFYSPDFILPNYVHLEAKGYWEPKDRRKILAVKKENPDLDLRMVFQAPYNTISKKSKTTYAQWCEKHDIPWCAFHTIPLDWLI
tara:strand:+ start:351 stop:722 length:372 start_codon:yes stop_codon:yes gene_type:complete